LTTYSDDKVVGNLGIETELSDDFRRTDQTVEIGRLTSANVTPGADDIRGKTATRTHGGIDREGVTGNDETER
jgi:hypothetical protein